MVEDRELEHEAGEEDEDGEHGGFGDVEVEAVGGEAEEDDEAEDPGEAEDGGADSVEEFGGDVLSEQCAGEGRGDAEAGPDERAAILNDVYGAGDDVDADGGGERESVAEEEVAGLLGAAFFGLGRFPEGDDGNGDDGEDDGAEEGSAGEFEVVFGEALEAGGAGDSARAEAGEVERVFLLAGGARAAEGSAFEFVAAVGAGWDGEVGHVRGRIPAGLVMVAGLDR